MDDFDRIVLEFMQETIPAPNVLIENPGTAEYDPSTGTLTATSTQTTSYGILMDLTLQSNGASLKYGTMVQQGDKELYLQPPATTTPVVQGQTKITVAGVVWSIVTMKEVNPTGVRPILYTLYVRR